MPLRQRLLQKQVQKMIMTAKMQQSMQLLQMPILELDQFIEAELATNPVLEEAGTPPETDVTYPESASPEPVQPTETQMESAVDTFADEDLARRLEWMSEAHIWDAQDIDHTRLSEDAEKHDFQETLITRSRSLQDDLLQQFRLVYTGSEDSSLAEYIIGNIAENGYVMTSIQEIAQSRRCTEAEVERVLELVQSLDPAGVAARDLRECLFLQLKRRGRDTSPEALIVQHHLQELGEKKYALISKALSLPIALVKECARRIAALDPKPCRNYSPEAMRIVPDVLLEKTPDGYDVAINSQYMPRLSISGMYRKMLKEKKCPKETLKFLREKLKSAQYLIEGLTQRQYTLERVCRYIVDFQKEALEKGVFHLKPLTLKEVAEHLGVHPSTISRTVMNKYMQTPYGTFPLKSFFSQAVPTASEGTVSNQKIKEALDELIKSEPAASPYSDQLMVDKLASQGLRISRRTVTKYRLALKIPPAHLRKRI